LSMQWFVSMKKLAEPALKAVMNDEVKVHPAKFKNVYRHWMENVKDWCISRQLWWGHRIPAWYLPNGEFVIAANDNDALLAARKMAGDNELNLSDLRQDEDVLDTWFSSWLWPISVFDGIRNPDNQDIKYYYPTNDLITAPEILFFWVARMIIAGYEYLGERPFENVYLTGIVRDQQRRKMSKSLGNSPDPVDLIKKYGADGVRIGMLLCSPAGNDLLFDESLTEQGRNFGNKIWNAFRLIAGWDEDSKLSQPEPARIGAEWFKSRLNKVIETIDDHYSKYRLSDALMSNYRLFWDDFSSWYLEIIKPQFGHAIDSLTKKQALAFFEKLMLILHPFMPFITEEIWHLMEYRKDGASIMISSMPESQPYDKDLLDRFERVKELLVFIRSVRADKAISPKETLDLIARPLEGDYSDQFDSVIVKLGKLSSIKISKDQTQNSVSQVVKSVEYSIRLEGLVDPAEEKKKIEKELEYTRGFLKAVEKKLQNERFVNHAPADVVEKENQKRTDAEAKIQALLDQLAGL